MDTHLLGAVNAHISEALNRPFNGRSWPGPGGGCINLAWRVEDETSCFFVKTNEARLLPMFEAEAAGLRAIYETQTIAAPQVVGWGREGAQAFLVLEWRSLGGRLDWRLMGQQLAQLHAHPVGDRFGWDGDNYIGATPQKNRYETDWIQFFGEHRLGWQARLAEKKGGRVPQLSRLLDVLPKFFADYQPQPSLLHGDLWSGNAGFDEHGPLIFDPAVYKGDRETDLAMTELFGGFPNPFYEAYQQTFPLNPGYAQRRELYNLYHILNHYNLFGGGYLSQANAMIDRLLQY